MLKTYVPLYRKYRPQTFKDLVGQDAISKTLSNAIHHNRVAHAYLFTGPRGTGKTSAARILAKSLNCEKGPTDSPCGVCSSCVDITNGNALDVVEIDAASNNSVQDARDLIERVQFASVSGRYKVYIIDEVHMLSTSAFNALLKTIEEPPENLVFILATTEAHKVLETIISRCQRFDFRRISQGAIVNRLMHIAEVENIKINKDALNLIARRSAGGLRDALGLLDQISVLSSMDEQIQVKDVLSLIGALPEELLIKVSDGIARRDGAYTLEIINKLLSYGSEPLQIVKELTIHFRNLLITSTVKDNLEDIIDASEEFYDDLKTISAQFKQIEVAQIIDKLSYTERMIRYTTQPILWLEVGLLSICYRQEMALIDDLQSRIESLESALAGAGVPSSISYKPAQSFKPISAPVKTVKKEEPKPVVIPEKTVIKAETPVAVPETPKEEELKVQPDLVESAKPDIVEHEEIDIPVEIEEVELEVEASSVVSAEPHLEEDEPVVVSKEPFSSGNIDAEWKAIIDIIKSPPTRGLLSSLAIPMAITPNEVIIGFTQEFFVDDIKNPRKRKFLEDALVEYYGSLPNLQFKLVSESQSKELKKNIQELAEAAPPVKQESVHKIVDEKTVNSDSKGEKLHRLQMNDDLQDDIEDKSPSIEMLEDVAKIEEPDLSEQVKLFIDTFQGKILKDAE
ncbi:MAG: DNA polymerase III subunit gamma/tau [Vampirovibrionia bacterium]